MNPTFRVSSGLIDPKHLGRMGASLKVFLWCVDHQTDEAGNVMYGRSLKITRIAEAVGIALQTTRRYVSRLVKSGYLSVKRTGHGVKIQVLNQKKWRSADRSETITQSDLKRSLGTTITQSDQKRSLAATADRSETITRVQDGRARDLHLKTATTTEREIFTPATPMDPAPALRVVTSEDRSEEANLGPPFDDQWKASTRAHLEARGWRCCTSCITGWANQATKLCDDCELRPRLVPAREGHA